MSFCRSAIGADESDRRDRSTNQQHPAATPESVTAIREIGNTIATMSETATAVASAIEQQGAATRRISRNVQQAAQGTHQVSSNITDVQRGASAIGSASAQALTAAKSVVDRKQPPQVRRQSIPQRSSRSLRGSGLDSSRQSRCLRGVVARASICLCGRRGGTKGDSKPSDRRLAWRLNDQNGASGRSYR
jgi:hypothetical protein